MIPGDDTLYSTAMRVKSTASVLVASVDQMTPLNVPELIIAAVIAALHKSAIPPLEDTTFVVPLTVTADLADPISVGVVFEASCGM
jgi:hypothetical protein